MEREFLIRLQVAVSASSLWDELGTDWLCLDCELMPWSAKAQELLQKQYAPVGNAGIDALKAENEIVAQAMLRVPGLEALSANTAARLDAVEQYSRAYREYCWPVSSLGDLKLAPFHILASEGSVHTGIRAEGCRNETNHSPARPHWLHRCGDLHGITSLSSIGALLPSSSCNCR